MTSNLSTRASAYPRRSKALRLALVSILAVVLVGSGGLLVNASASTKFDNVQVFIQTSQDLPYSYSITAYNTSGFQVAYYQSSFAAAALELPAGTYLFTASASYSPPNYLCAGGICKAEPLTSTSATVAKAMPVELLSSNEYGYALEQITGPSSITINTQNATAVPTTQVTVHVAYANGTAAQGAWVYGSVVGNYNYYGPNIVSDVQTGADGTAVLTMPQAPIQVTSYLTVPITLPQTQSTVTVTIAGQKVNVTLYWEPNSIALEGQTLILPPQTSGSITLQYQPQQYVYPVSYESSTPGVAVPTITRTMTTGAAGGTTVATASTTTSQNTVTDKIAPFNPSNVQVATPVSPSTVTTTVAAQGLGGESMLLVGGAAALVVALAALTLVLVTVRGKRKPNIVSA